MQNEIQKLFAAIFPGEELQGVSQDISFLFSSLLLEKVFKSLKSEAEKKLAMSLIEQADFPGLAEFLQERGIDLRAQVEATRADLAAGLGDAIAESLK